MTEQLPFWPEPRAAAAAPFRPFHYLGSKVRLAEQIATLARELDPTLRPALDLFSGTGVVAAQLALERDVTAVDVQEYARVSAAALLSDTAVASQDLEHVIARADTHYRLLADGPLSAILRHEAGAVAEAAAGRAERLCDLTEYGMLAMERGQEHSGPELKSALRAAGGLRQTGVGVGGAMVLTRYYGGVYFSYQQAARLDALCSAIEELPTLERVVALATVLSTASNSVISVGSQFAQPVRARGKDGRPKPGSVTALVRGRTRDPILLFRALSARFQLHCQSRSIHSTVGDAVRADYAAFLRACEAEFGVVYADPPYTRDHYSRFYHVLETIAVGDEPAVSTIDVRGELQLSRGLYRESRHQSPFSIKSQAPGAFVELFRGVRNIGAPLLVSYSPYAEDSSQRPRLMRVQEITELAEEHFSSVEVRPALAHSHSKLNAARLNVPASGNAEVFLLCQP